MNKGPTFHRKDFYLSATYLLPKYFLPMCIIKSMFHIHNLSALSTTWYTDFKYIIHVSKFNEQHKVDK